MKTINQALIKFKDNIHSIEQVAKIGSDVGEITLGFLNALKKENEPIHGFVPYKEKLDRVINQIQKIKEHPELKKKYSVIYNQSLVLIVSSVESFLTDVAITIVNSYYELIEWPKENQKITFEVNVLDYKFPTIGEIIINSLKEVNFQDLQSTLRFFKDYIKINLNLSDELKDDIIKYQALRHTIIHNFSKIDDIFLRQVRDTRFAKAYSIGTNIKLNEEDYIFCQKIFLGFADMLVDKINNRIRELYSEEFFKINEEAENS